MDKNIAAFLRNDCKTIKVCFINDRFPGQDDTEMTLLGKDFALSPKGYIYVTDIQDIKPDDMVVVYAVGIPKVAIVMEVNEDVDIKPNDNKSYGWVVCRVDFMSYLENMKKNTEITRTVSKAYKASARKQFAAMLLADMDEESRTRLLTITEVKQNA